MKIITLTRSIYTPDTTIGKITIPEKNFECFTLEDAVRAWGVKVDKHTAIPVTTDFFYNVHVTYSTRFKKELPIIFTEIDKDGNYLIKNGGIQFSAVRFHGGNSKDDTEGCPLVAFNFDGKDKIYNEDKNNRADDALTAIIKEWLKSDTVGLKVVNQI